MIKIVFKKELNKVKLIPHEVQKVIEGILKILDIEYGSDKYYEDDGGYVVVIEKSRGFRRAKGEIIH